jgi:3-hydroxyisobutyrate dehydrogenase
MTNITFLGLGAMGSRMAANLLKAGHAVTVWNRSAAAAGALAAAGAAVAGSPKAAAAGADIVFAMVRDDAASQRVWLDPADGALAGMRKGAVAVECSTLTVDHVRQLSVAAQAAGVGFLDAPVAGSRPQAEAAALIFLVGGPATEVERVRPALAAMGKALHHLGPVGTGASVKLAVNSLLAVQVTALAELTGMLRRQGVDLARALDVIADTPVASPAGTGAAASMLAGSFAPLFPAELAEKDIGYLLAAAGEDRAPVNAATRTVLAKAIHQGFGGDHLSGVARLYA